MSKIPGCQPDGPAIRALIWDRGVSVPEFARSIGRKKTTIWGILANGDRASITSIRQIAAGLRVKPGAISDWKGDDATWKGDDSESGTEQIPA